MSRQNHLSVAALSLVLVVPFAWLACGGSKPPPETPADESSSEPGTADSSAASPDTATSAAPDTSAAAADTSSSMKPDTAATAAAAPPSSPLGGSDCGKCIDKTCAKQAAACGKNTDCQATIDAIHGCTSAAASCIDGATPPAAAKPKKLAAAYETCAKKAASKACKAKCQ